MSLDVERLLLCFVWFHRETPAVHELQCISYVVQCWIHFEGYNQHLFGDIDHTVRYIPKDGQIFNERTPTEVLRIIKELFA